PDDQRAVDNARAATAEKTFFIADLPLELAEHLELESVLRPAPAALAQAAVPSIHAIVSRRSAGLRPLVHHGRVHPRPPVERRAGPSFLYLQAFCLPQHREPSGRLY